MLHYQKYLPFIIIGSVLLFFSPVAYYFFYALPNHNAAMLELEVERLNVESQQAEEATAAAEQAIQDQKALLMSCLDNVNSVHDNVVDTTLTPKFEECNHLFYEVDPVNLDAVDSCMYILDELTKYNDEKLEDGKNDCYLLYD